MLGGGRTCSIEILIKWETSAAWKKVVNPLIANPKNGQTHSKNLSAIAEELFECVWLICGVGA